MLLCAEGTGTLLSEIYRKIHQERTLLLEPLSDSEDCCKHFHLFSLSWDNAEWKAFGSIRIVASHWATRAHDHRRSMEIGDITTHLDIVLSKL